MSLGFGLDWRNYRITTADVHFAETDGVLSLQRYDSDVYPSNSRLKTFSINVPLMVRQDLPMRMFGMRQYVAVGVSANFVTRSSILTRVHTADGNTLKWTSRDIDCRKVNFDVVGILGVTDAFGLYAKYCPRSILNPSATTLPDFKSFVVGLIFLY